MDENFRGMITQLGNIMHIGNALVEEVSPNGDDTGYLIISYTAPQEEYSTHVLRLRLNVTQKTLLLNIYAQNMSLSDIQAGMWINVIFSGMMTKSMPPQTNAFLIIIRQDVIPSSELTIAPIAFVDPENHLLYTGNPDDINTQTRFMVPQDTPIFNRAGQPIPLSCLQPGQTVRIIHANFQTASIPPQTTAYHIQLI